MEISNYSTRLFFLSVLFYLTFILRLKKIFLADFLNMLRLIVVGKQRMYKSSCLCLIKLKNLIKKNQILMYGLKNNQVKRHGRNASMSKFHVADMYIFSNYWTTCFKLITIFLKWYVNNETSILCSKNNNYNLFWTSKLDLEGGADIYERNIIILIYYIRSRWVW